MGVGGVGAAASGRRWGAVLAATMGVVIAIIGIVDWADPARMVGGVVIILPVEALRVSVGAGLVLTTIGGFVLAGASVWAYMTTQREQSPAG